VMSVQPAIDAIGIGTQDAARNYFDALRAAETTVQDDILSSTPGVRSRTRYVVLWIADGPPVPDLRVSWCMGHGHDPADLSCTTAFTTEFCSGIQPTPSDCEMALYQQKAADLRAYALEHGAEDLVFDTFALSGDKRTSDLLTNLAFASQGAFFQQTPPTLNLLKVDIAASSSVLLQRGFVVYNPNMILRGGVPVPDSDGDGLTDDDEARLGTDPTRADTDGDNVGDGIEVRLSAPGLSFDPLVAHTPDACINVDPPDGDSDGDGLLDCEEAVLRTDASLVDTDRDGLPDQVEWNRGSDPLVDDLLTDSDGDGIPNGIEVREGLGALAGDAAYELDYGYRYNLTAQQTKTPLEAIPHDPIPGVLAIKVDGVASTVGTLIYAAGPPQTLRFASNDTQGNFGPAVDVSKGGSFDLVSSLDNASQTRTISVSVTPAALPDPEPTRPTECPKDLSIACDQIVEVLIRTTVRSCFHFDVRNITLTSPKQLPGGRPGAGWNGLQVYLGALPQAAPNGYLVYDLASVPVRFVPPDHKTPNQPYITLDTFSFVLLEGSP